MISGNNTITLIFEEKLRCSVEGSCQAVVNLGLCQLDVVLLKILWFFFFFLYGELISIRKKNKLTQQTTLVQKTDYLNKKTTGGNAIFISSIIKGWHLHLKSYSVIAFRGGQLQVTCALLLSDKVVNLFLIKYKQKNLFFFFW